ncbi:hypothetical protein BDV36DRAFT_285585 [Aspergillus pseudocaelatus]|uniref:Polynucleotide 5'-hydroxyl-kinase GRC3 n=1 Tax=Aspergillus pseudocaelatus TaxID=1825620 RepID=A0ABQ6WDE0_9EURO|nr:hypothetical protein BDV36DRAFT_285585 [Aspergillus pseudocaelatus]
MFKIAFPWAKLEEERSEREYVKARKETSEDEIAGNVWISPILALELAKEYQMYDWVRALLDPTEIVQTPSSTKKHMQITPPPRFDLPPIEAPAQLTAAPRLRRGRSASPSKKLASPQKLASPRKPRSTRARESKEAQDVKEVKEASIVATSEANANLQSALDATAEAGSVNGTIQPSVEHDEERVAPTPKKSASTPKSTKTPRAARAKELKGLKELKEVEEVVETKDTKEENVKVDVKTNADEARDVQTTQTTVSVEVPISLLPDAPSAEDTEQMIAKAKEMVEEAAKLQSTDEEPVPSSSKAARKRNIEEALSDDEEDEEAKALRTKRAKVLEEKLKRERVRNRALVGVTAAFALANAMSLPGLDLTQPSADNQFAPAPPTQISLSKGSEWRFEVAFGTVIRVKNAGKTSVAKILTAYATKVERQPIVVNLDPTEGMLSVPGTLTATAFRTMMDVEEGWGSSPMSGPSAVPVKLPLVYFYPMQNPLEAEGSVYRPIVSRLALSVMGRMAEDEEARETGIIVDTPGALSQGKPGSLEMINHIVTEFSITTILVIGSERLYSLMMKNYDNKPTSSASAVASDERITVVKLSKSGGCVDRDAAFMKGIRESQIRTYFFGNPIPSTASAALSLSASSTTNVTLSPHAQQLDFNTLGIYNYTIASLEEDEDEYDPSQLGAGDSFLPGGGNDAEVSQAPQDEPARATPLPGIISSIESATPAVASNVPLKKVSPPAPSTLANSLIAITNAPTTASAADVRDASIMGFLYVAEVDSEKGKIRALAPVGGRVPPRAIVWGKKWPGEVVGLVG